jgi:predicted nucleic acid-binding protein
MMDVVVDTDILSTLTKVGKTALLQQLFPKSKIILCPSVQSEISKAVKMGILDSAPANFSQVELTPSEKNVAKEVSHDDFTGQPSSFLRLRPGVAPVHG